MKHRPAPERSKYSLGLEHWAESVRPQRRGREQAVKGPIMAGEGHTNRYLLTGVEWEGHQW